MRLSFSGQHSIPYISACHKRLINVNLRHSCAALQKFTRISTHIG